MPINPFQSTSCPKDRPYKHIYVPIRKEGLVPQAVPIDDPVSYDTGWILENGVSLFDTVDIPDDFVIDMNRSPLLEREEYGDVKIIYVPIVKYSYAVHIVSSKEPISSRNGWRDSRGSSIEDLVKIPEGYVFDFDVTNHSTRIHMYLSDHDNPLASDNPTEPDFV